MPAGRTKLSCGHGSHFHLDDCVGCGDFLDCAKKQPGFNAEYFCPNCYWLGRTTEHKVKFHEEFPELSLVCPICGGETEEVN